MRISDLSSVVFSSDLSGVLQRHPEQLRAVAVHPGPDRPAAWPRLPPGSDLMTRTPTRRLLVLALATAITAPAAWAQETVDPQAAFGIAPPQPAANALAPAVRPDSSFTVSDIRVDGLQRKIGRASCRERVGPYE